MSLNIVKAETLADTDGLNMLVYAEPGTGKTHLAKTATGKVLVVDFEEGTATLSGEKNIDILRVDKDMKNWREIWDFVSETKEYKTIFLDSVTDLYKRMLLVCAENGKNSGLPEQRDYMYVYLQIGQILREFRALKTKGIEVVVTAHEKIVKEHEADGRLISRLHPDVPEKIMGEVEGLFDIVARIEISKKDESKGKRFLRLEKTDNIVAKNRINNKNFCIADIQEFKKKEK